MRGMGYEGVDCNTKGVEFMPWPEVGGVGLGVLKKFSSDPSEIYF